MNTSIRNCLLASVLAPACWSVDLTVTGSFATNEDVPLVFSYSELLAKCTVSETPDGFKIVGLATDGTTEIGASQTGPWSTPNIASATMVAGQYIRFTPTRDLWSTGIQIMSIKAYVGAVSSPTRTALVDIAAVNDVIAAANGTFTQPTSGAVVTEDTPFTFTFADLVATLGVADPDGQAYKLRITGLDSGSLSTVGGVAITTFPYDVASGGSVRWQAAGNAFTRSDEPPISALRVRAINTEAPLDQTNEVHVATAVAGVTDDLGGQQTTLGSLYPLVMNAGIATSFTYDQLVAHVHNTNAVDRDGTIAFILSEAANGMIFRQYGSDGTLVAEYTTFPITPRCSPGGSIQIRTLDHTPPGMKDMGTVALATPSSTYSTPVTLKFDVRSSSGGTGDNAGASSGGGGCGAGTALGCIVATCACLLRPRRRR